MVVARRRRVSPSIVDSGNDIREQQLATLKEQDFAEYFAEWRSKLAIDRDHLDDCVSQQPESYLHVAEGLAYAIARRDRLKYDLDIVEAEEAQRIRHDAAVAEEKITEGGLREQLTLSPKLRQLRERRLDAEQEIGAWSSLKESYQQRSYMLRELVPMHLSRLGGGSMRFDGRDNRDPKSQMADYAAERRAADNPPDLLRSRRRRPE